MPKRFLLTSDAFQFDDSPGQAANHLHALKAGRDITALKLKPDRQGCLAVPADEILIMMGTTPELKEELRKLEAQGIKAIVTGRGASVQYSGRTKTTETGGVGKSHDVTVIAVPGSACKFNMKEWNEKATGNWISLTNLIDTELDLIKANQ
jgi:hypothetical protein